MTEITTRPAEPGDAPRFVDLAARAFANVSEHARPKESPEFVAHTHGSSNPAGRALVTLAEKGGRLVGHVSAIPFRYRRSSGAVIVGWQIGCFVVDGSEQRQGIGPALLADQRQALGRTGPQDFVFAYPNARSLGNILRQGGLAVARGETRIVVPSGSRSGSRSRTVRDADGARWSVETVDAETARANLARREDPEPARGAFVRDRDYFLWRFLSGPAAPRYRFALAAGPRGESLLLALSEHSVRGVRFTILVDAHPDVFDGRLAAAVRLARAAGGGRPVYLTTNAAWKGGPLSLGVPRRFDPRPVERFLMPGRDDLAGELARAPILTADWMGF